jgi:hypothetical protein
MASVLGAGASCAQSLSWQITGTAGYLAEWELSGSVRERPAADGSEFFGTIIWKHVGLCSVEGPQEKEGKISFRISGSSHRISLTISLEDIQCTYNSESFSGSSSGRMDCSNAKGVPLSISLQQ